MALSSHTIIDIQLLKIVDWLVRRFARNPSDCIFCDSLLWQRRIFLLQVERRFLQTEWRSKNKALQLKAAELASSFSEEEFQEYKGLKHYLAARNLRDRLLAGAEKNFLGYYKGEAGVWDKLIRAYEVESKLIMSLWQCHGLHMTARTSYLD